MLLMNKPTQKAFDPLYSRRNYLLLLVSILIVVLGYICLAIKPVDGTLTMVVAPILLVAGYCVLLPISLFLRPSKNPGEQRK